HEALALARRKLGLASPSTRTCLRMLADCYTRSRQPAEAEALLRECLAFLQKKQPDGWELPQTQSLLGAALAGGQKPAEAEPLLLAGYKGLKAREQALPALSRKRLLTGALERLVQFYEASGQPRKAAEWRQQLEEKPSGPEA